MNGAKLQELVANTHKLGVLLLKEATIVSLITNGTSIKLFQPCFLSTLLQPFRNIQFLTHPGVHHAATFQHLFYDTYLLSFIHNNQKTETQQLPPETHNKEHRQRT